MLKIKLFAIILPFEMKSLSSLDRRAGKVWTRGFEQFEKQLRRSHNGNSDNNVDEKTTNAQCLLYKNLCNKPITHGF